MRILVTGSNGYLGRQLTCLAMEAQMEVIQVVRKPAAEKFACNLIDKIAVSELIKLARPDLILHCAAFVPKNLDDYKNNQLSSQNTEILRNIIYCSDCPIVYISSMTVYGRPLSLLCRETDLCIPESSYACSKYECELLLQDIKRDSLSLRIPGLFGGGRDTGLVANTLKAMAQRLPPNLPAEPIVWAAMEIGDAAKNIFSLCQSKFSGATAINIGYEDTYSINNFLHICEEMYGERIEYDVQHPNFSFDLTLSKSLGIFPARTLKAALQEQKNIYEHGSLEEIRARSN